MVGWSVGRQTEKAVALCSSFGDIANYLNISHITSNNVGWLVGWLSAYLLGYSFGLNRAIIGKLDLSVGLFC